MKNDVTVKQEMIVYNWLIVESTVLNVRKISSRTAKITRSVGEYSRTVKNKERSAKPPRR